MRVLVFLLAWLPLIDSARAEDTTTTMTPSPSPAQLDQLLSPIALYPDPLVALILPAATVPSDITLAARYLENKGDTSQIADQPWDESVRALAHYPDIISWMDKNLEWTTSVGEAYQAAPKDAMASVQRLRSQAKAMGNLKDTPEQKVDTVDGNLRIVPVEANVLYVPVYDADVVYVHPGYRLAFGMGYPVGPWLTYDWYWGSGIWVGDWRPGWYYHGAGWGHPWFVDRHRPHPRHVSVWARPRMPYPKPMVGFHERSYEDHRRHTRPVSPARNKPRQPPVHGKRSREIRNHPPGRGRDRLEVHPSSHHEQNFHRERGFDSGRDGHNGKRHEGHER